MNTASVMAGSPEVGEMVFTSETGPIWKLIRSAPGVLLAAVIASRRVQPPGPQMPSPGSAVLVTVNVVSAWAGLATSIRLEAVKSTASKKLKARAFYSCQTAAASLNPIPTRSSGSASRGSNIHESAALRLACSSSNRSSHPTCPEPLNLGSASSASAR